MARNFDYLHKPADKVLIDPIPAKFRRVLLTTLSVHLARTFVIILKSSNAKKKKQKKLKKRANKINVFQIENALAEHIRKQTENSNKRKT